MFLFNTFGEFTKELLFYRSENHVREPSERASFSRKRTFFQGSGTLIFGTLFFCSEKPRSNPGAEGFFLQLFSGTWKKNVHIPEKKTLSIDLTLLAKKKSPKTPWFEVLAKHRTGAVPGFDSAQNLAFADNLFRNKGVKLTPQSKMGFFFVFYATCSMMEIGKRTNLDNH